MIVENESPGVPNSAESQDEAYRPDESPTDLSLQETANDSRDVGLYEMDEADESLRNLVDDGGGKIATKRELERELKREGVRDE